jgi:hypothetical protein
MVETIGPMVDEARRKGPLVRAAHVVGGLVGGAALGGLAGLVGSLVGTAGLSSTARSVLLVASVMALVYDLATHGRRMGLGRQTPIGWRSRFSPTVASFLYGLDLGTGITTRLYFASYLVAVLAAAIAGEVWIGAAIGAAFGGTRALVAVLVGRRAMDRPTIVDDLAERRSSIEILNAIALVQFVAVTYFVCCI